MSVFHLLYGLLVASDHPIPGLAIVHESCADRLQVYLKQPVELAPQLDISGRDFFYSSPHSDGNGTPLLRVGKVNPGGHFVFLYSDGVRFVVDCEGRRIWADWPTGYSLEDACTYLIGPVIAFALRLRGVVSLHASAITVGDQAIALMGAPGAGKSTTAAAFALRGFPILSDDVVVLADQSTRFLAQPGYPRVNLWPDSVQALFGSEDSLPLITPTWQKRFLSLNQGNLRFESKALPLGAIYILEPRQANLAAPAIREVPGIEAMMTLISNTYVNYLLDSDMRAREFEVLSRLFAEVPIRCVSATDDPSKISALCEAIATDARQQMSRGSAESPAVAV